MITQNKITNNNINYKKLYFFLPFLVWILVSVFVLYYGVNNISKLLLYVPDDSFYYFKISENLLKGYWFSFDTITKTNGFHPLWLFVITPLIHFFGKNFSPIIILSSLFFFTGNFIFTMLIERVSSEKYARTFSYLISLNPLVIIFSINGLETGLLYCIFSIFMYYIIINSFDTKIHFIILGIISALLFLSRTDSSFIIIIGAYFGHIRTLIPATSGRRFGIIRTAFRLIRTPCRVN